MYKKSIVQYSYIRKYVGLLFKTQNMYKTKKIFSIICNLFFITYYK